jgi:two-component system sensor histidine kinase KdpD
LNLRIQFAVIEEKLMETFKKLQAKVASQGPLSEFSRSFAPLSYLCSIAGVALMTLILKSLSASVTLSNVHMLYLLVVIVASTQFGRVVAIFTSLLCVLCADYFFVKPFYSLNVADFSEWVALAVFMLVAVVTGQLTARLRIQAQAASQHDQEMTTLAETSWEVASELDTKRAMSYILRRIASLLDVIELAVVVADGEEKVQVFVTEGLTLETAQALLTERWREAVRFVLRKALPLGSRPLQFPNSSSAHEAYKSAGEYDNLPFSLVPIIFTEESVSAVLYLKMAETTVVARREQQILTALVNHLGLLLQREQLFKAEAKAQAVLEADKMKTALLAMVSHDFRSPLTSIKATIQTLKSTGEALAQEEQKSLLDDVDFEVDRINRMVTNILDLSRLEAGAWRPKLESTPISEIIGMTLAGFGARANARITVQNEARQDSARLDSVQIVQVLHNLIENALKYSPANSEVRLRALETESYLEFVIEDRGIGLVSGEELQIFKPFYRGKSLSESNVPGVGIGLAICSGLVEAHGGKIEAQNREGGGATFRVTLPV